MVAMVLTSAVMMVKVGCRPAKSHAFTHHYIEGWIQKQGFGRCARVREGLLSSSDQIRKAFGGGGGGGALPSGRKKGRNLICKWGVATPPPPTPYIKLIYTTTGNCMVDPTPGHVILVVIPCRSPEYLFSTVIPVHAAIQLLF